MSLRCMSDDGELRAYLLDESDWADLKKSYKQQGLSMHCHLGCILERSPAVRCVVLSKDKGFDPLLSHLYKTEDWPQVQAHRNYGVRRSRSAAGNRGSGL